jgi:2-succinyl-6-hydroxy-2,4-cyclohexadiene-1-carboxylate synthase
MSLHEIGGLRYHVEEIGAGEPLVLLHGFTGSAESWRNVMAVFGERYRAIAIEFPGHGLTDKPQAVEHYRMERVAADMMALLDKIGATPAHWLGYSMGGRLALYMAVHCRQIVRSVVLESASPGLADPAERRARRSSDEALAASIEAEGTEPFVAAWEALPLFASQASLSPAVRSKLREQRLNNSPRGLAGSLRGMGTGVQPSLWGHLGEVDRPVLLLAGELDAKFAAINNRMTGAMPTARFEMIPGAGHAIHLERPEVFIQIVGDFLANVSQVSRQNLPQTKQRDKDQRSNGQLLEPGVEARQVIDAADRQPIAHEKRQSQDVEELPGTGVIQQHVGRRQQDGKDE